VIPREWREDLLRLDIAYHFDKLQRGHELLIDVWGADITVTSTRSARRAGWRSAARRTSFEVCLMQLVSLFRGGEKLAMGKREGNFVTLRDCATKWATMPAGSSICCAATTRRSISTWNWPSPRSNENPCITSVRACARVVGDEAARLEGLQLRRRRRRPRVADTRTSRP
jgi:arginyl-tRNA synthetase